MTVHTITVTGSPVPVSWALQWADTIPDPTYPTNPIYQELVDQYEAEQK